MIPLHLLVKIVGGTLATGGVMVGSSFVGKLVANSLNASKRINEKASLVNEVSKDASTGGIEDLDATSDKIFSLLVRKYLRKAPEIEADPNLVADYEKATGKTFTREGWAETMALNNFNSFIETINEETSGAKEKARKQDEDQRKLDLALEAATIKWEEKFQNSSLSPRIASFN